MKYTDSQHLVAVSIGSVRPIDLTFTSWSIDRFKVDRVPPDCVVVSRCEDDVVPAAARLGRPGLGVVEATVQDDRQGRESVEWARGEVLFLWPVDFFPFSGISEQL